MMSKTKKIIYWISTIWLSLGMVSSGIVQLFKIEEGIAFILDLGYPRYFLTLLAIWKLLGVAAFLMPRYPLIKEWAYAGFFFMMSGAVYSHIAMGTTNEMVPAAISLVLIVISWYSRPASRKPNSNNPSTLRKA